MSASSGTRAPGSGVIRGGIFRDDHLIHECAVFLKYLNAIALSIADIDEPVTRTSETMEGKKLGWHWCVGTVDGRGFIVRSFSVAPPNGVCTRP